MATAKKTETKTAEKKAEVKTEAKVEVKAEPAKASDKSIKIKMIKLVVSTKGYLEKGREYSLPEKYAKQLIAHGEAVNA